MCSEVDTAISDNARNICIVVIPINVLYDKQTDGENICCICLEPCQQDSSANLTCCKIDIHDRCLFRIVLHNLHKCPICRRDMDIDQLFTDKVIRQYFESFSKQEQSRYMNLRNNLLMRQYRFYCSSILSSRVIRMLCILIAICLFYMCLFLALTTFQKTTLYKTHNHNYHHNHHRNYDHNHNHNHDYDYDNIDDYNSMTK